MAADDKQQDPKPDGGKAQEPERYPSVRQDDAVERTGRSEEVAPEGRSFDPSVNAPTPHPEPGSKEAKQEGFEGPQGDPAEVKRR